MRMIFYHNDTEEMTLNVLTWLVYRDDEPCTSLKFAAGCTLEVEVSQALVNSSKAAFIESLEFTEIYFTPEQLAELLTLPALVELRIGGGESYDWNGPTTFYDTLESEHIDVLTTSPDAQRLRSLELVNQGFSERLGTDLRRALPNLETLKVEGTAY